MFEQFVQNVLGEVHLIAEAPLVFGAAVFFLGAIIWAMLRWRYSAMRIGWKAQRNTSMNDIPDGLTVWPEDDVARAICNALTMATGALVTLREDRHLKDQGTYTIAIGYKLD